MHPFYDTKKLTDEQIIQKLQKCYSHRGAEQRYGHTSMIESINQIIFNLETEQQLRIQSEIEKSIKDQHPTIDDPINLGSLDLENNNEN